MLKKIIFITALTATSCLSFAQSNLSQISTTELNVQVQSLIAQGSWTAARPYANELIKRFEGAADARNNETLFSLYYLRAYGYFQDFLSQKKASNLAMAIEDLDKIIEAKTSAQVRNAIDLKALCYESQGNFKDSAETLGILLKPPYVYQLKTSEQLGLIRRIVSNLYAQRDWKDNDKWFLKLLNDSHLPEDKAMSASALMQSAIENKDYEEAMKYLPYMTIDAPARYDISLNISFLNAAKELSAEEVERYADAAVFYSLTYTKAKIVEFFTAYKKESEERLAELKAINPKHSAIPIVEGRIVLSNNQIKGLAKVEEYAPILMLGKAVNYQATKRMYESYWAYTQMIDYFPNSKQIEEYYYFAFMAALEIEKIDDMAALGEEYMKKFPKGRFIKSIKLEMSDYYYNNKMLDEFYQIAYDYVDNYNTDQTCEKIVFQMGESWVINSNYAPLIRNFESYLRKYPKAVVKASLHYWLGLGAMGAGDYKKSYENFNAVVAKYPKSMYIEDASFRLGIAAYGNQDLDRSMEVFKNFVAKFPESNSAGEAEFFIGDIYMAKGFPVEALKHYALVEGKTTTQDYIDNAYIQSISIENQARNYAKVVALADKYIKNHPNGNVAIMLFEKAKALNEIGQQGDTVQTFKDLIVKFGNNPRLSGVDKALAEYKDHYEKTTITLNDSKAFVEEVLQDAELLKMLVDKPGDRYRYFLARPTIDNGIYIKFKNNEKFSENLYEDIQPLKDLLAHLNNQIDAIPDESPLEFFTMLLNDNKGKNPTLEFRAMMALDSIGATIPNRGFKPDDYAWASPSTLIWIAKQNEKYSANEALNTYQYILTSGADSQYMFDALMGMAQLQERQGKFDGENGALRLFERLENEYPSDLRAWQATMEFGEALAAAGKISKAKEKFDYIRRNPAWRGEAVAGALYNLGKLAEASNNNDEALSFYDNCAIGHSNFVMYSGKAALAEINLYKKMGDTEKAVETALAFLSTASATKAPEYQDIVDASKNL